MRIYNGTMVVLWLVLVLVLMLILRSNINGWVITQIKKEMSNLLAKELFDLVDRKQWVLLRTRSALLDEEGTNDQLHISSAHSRSSCRLPQTGQSLKYAGPI